MNIRWVVAGLALALLSAPGAFAELKPLNPKADRNERWNWFVEAAYALHQKQIEGREIDTVERLAVTTGCRSSTMRKNTTIGKPVAC